MSVRWSLIPAAAPAAAPGAVDDAGVDVASGACDAFAGAAVGAGVGLGGSGSFVITGPIVLASCLAAVTVGRWIGLEISSKLEASSSDSTSSLSANLETWEARDCLLSFSDGGGSREATDAGVGAALGASVFVGGGLCTRVGADADAEGALVSAGTSSGAPPS
jgi:hypothetical protein